MTPTPRHARPPSPRVVWLWLCLLALGPADTALAAGIDARIAAELADARPGAVELAGERVHMLDALRLFYAARDHAPVWVSERGYTPAGLNVLKALAAADSDGLQPRDYHLEALEALGAQGSPDPATVELLLTDGYFLYARHLTEGKVDPASLAAAWQPQRRYVDVVGLLERAIEADSIVESLLAQRPPHAAYEALRRALAEARQAPQREAGPPIPSGPTLRPGAVDPRLPRIRERVAHLQHEAPPVAAESTRYDPALAASIEALQSANGLTADGIIGPRTLAMLNAAPADRIAALRANLERWRWLPPSLGDHYIQVNIAAGSLQVVRGGELIMQQAVVVGAEENQTPAFSRSMGYLVVNPYWNVPASIARNEILPALKRDPGYAARNRYEILSGWGENARVIDPYSVNWRAIAPGSFPYRVRQRPGGNNALGELKFMFPNPYSIYLHDTPAKQLFARGQRTFSHGCIRVEDPKGLALHLLDNQAGWDQPRLQRAIDSDRTQSIKVTQPVAVHVQYWTAGLDAEGTLRWWPDVYGRDAPLVRALDGPVRLPG
ncbi:MAG: L,D-transpeptidase family protein [Pseudomonadota bacterium]|nr:L,D-transpeptidase family protein [Pseudomonadota bacterium]